MIWLAVPLMWWTIGATLTFVAFMRETDSKLLAFVVAATWPISLLVGLYRELQ